MPTPSLAIRVGGVIASSSLLACLAACAAQPTLNITMPTMAPDQSLAEACAISGEEVDRITREVETQIQSAIDQAGSEISAGNLPSFELFAEPIDTAIAEIEVQITNPDVLDAIGELRTSVQGFADIERPESALGYPGYLSELGSQMNKLASAGEQLQSLCITPAQP